MKEEDIVEIAIENLQKNVGIKAKWTNDGIQGLDGRIEITVENRRVQLDAEIKLELRSHQLVNIVNQSKGLKHLIVIAQRIFPQIKAELRNNQISYLEGNGNIYLSTDDLLVWVDNQQPIKMEKSVISRAFTKTGLKVVFYFLLNENNLNLPYREISAQTEVALGNINYVMSGLKETGFLIKWNKEQYRLTKKKELLDKWMIAYKERLKPNLKVGSFRFLKDEDFTNWKKLPLRSGKTWWGGEPAGDIFTDYLRPAELTLYTTETRSELIKNYRLIPDETGNVKAYKKFWLYEEVNDNVVPPLLVYADLINTNDRRCIETAQKIYDELLQNKL